jgi:DNA adenine methylase
MKNIFPKPLLKWVGGKSQIIDKILEFLPNEINNYHEFFLGGASVLFMLLYLINNKKIKINGKIYAYDINQTLISFYNNIQLNPNSLYDKVIEIVNLYKEKNNSKEKFYYTIRNQFNSMNQTEKNSVVGSALFLFLNKTCFRGLYREGPHGFNVAYGNYSNPEIINYEHLMEIHNLIQNVNFICIDFDAIDINSILENDLLYLDPPYFPENINSFVKYTKNGFGITKHQKLIDLIHLFSKSSKKIILSNSNIDFITQNFTNNQEYKITYVNCQRKINSKNPNHQTSEVLVTNF